MPGSMNYKMHALVVEMIVIVIHMRSQQGININIHIKINLFAIAHVSVFIRLHILSIPYNFT